MLPASRHSCSLFCTLLSYRTPAKLLSDVLPLATSSCHLLQSAAAHSFHHFAGRWTALSTTLHVTVYPHPASGAHTKHRAPVAGFYLNDGLWASAPTLRAFRCPISEGCLGGTTWNESCAPGHHHALRAPNCLLLFVRPLVLHARLAPCCSGNEGVLCG